VSNLERYGFRQGQFSSGSRGRSSSAGRSGARGAGGGVELKITTIRLKQAAKELGVAPKVLKREIRQRMRKLGRVLQMAWRDAFVGQMTDPVSRHRDDNLPVLGTFSGKSKRTIGVRTKFPNPNKPGTSVFKTFVGPRGGAGIPGPGFYLAFHEFGDSFHPRRPVAAGVKRRHQARINRELEAVVNEILRGW